MGQVVRSIEAQEDLHDIGAYIARGSLQNALKMLDRFEQQAKLLAEFPGLGQARDDLAPSLRSWPVGKYLLFYRATVDGIELVRVIHGSRDLYRLFRRPRP